MEKIDLNLDCKVLAFIANTFNSGAASITIAQGKDSSDNKMVVIRQQVFPEVWNGDHDEEIETDRNGRYNFVIAVLPGFAFQPLLEEIIKAANIPLVGEQKGKLMFAKDEKMRWLKVEILETDQYEVVQNPYKKKPLEDSIEKLKEIKETIYGFVGLYMSNKIADILAAKTSEIIINLKHHLKTDPADYSAPPGEKLKWIRLDVTD